MRLHRAAAFIDWFVSTAALGRGETDKLCKPNSFVARHPANLVLLLVHMGDRESGVDRKRTVPQTANEPGYDLPSHKVSLLVFCVEASGLVPNTSSFDLAN